MASALMRTGIGVVGDVPWGTHFCQFYETKEDLLNTLAPYFKAGLEDGELCVWVISGPVTEDEASSALRRVVPDLDRYLLGGSIEMVPAQEWYLERGKAELQRVTRAWNAKLSGALARGYPGMRVSGNTAWLEKKDWKDFCEYEEQLNSSITDKPMAVLCTYPLMTSGAAELLDVARNHQFAIAKRQGTWEVIETAQLKRAKAEMVKVNEALEQRVIERTVELDAAQAERRQAEVELAHVTRVTTLGELASSMAHELNQPLAAVVTNGNACLRWLARDEPNLEEATKAVTRMIRDANRAADVIAHTRALLRRSSGEKARLDVGDVIRDALTFVEPEALRHRVAIRKMIAADLPAVWGDRIQLQQVILNLVVNGIEAMTDVPESDRARDLQISGERIEIDGRPALLVAVEDSGLGVTPERLDRLFEPFFTTKPAGLGMGLPISRSLVQAHGGQLSATRNAGHGTTFRLILPAAGPSDP